MIGATTTDGPTRGEMMTDATRKGALRQSISANGRTDAQARIVEVMTGEHRSRTVALGHAGPVATDETTKPGFYSLN